ncbi:MAG: TraR/DksA family transcriptional regulator, DnaK suppressor protein [Candidatus Dadabacteria bacterium CSP1-2]|nr:MAG: TraR/DksA family transcriptional regulator, DnaK suppressor protein [Candidatus Dadabacteria bacterium CSP1-2]
MIYIYIMNPEKLEFFKGILLEKMNLLIDTAGKTMSEMSQEDDSFPDPLDRAMSESSRTIELRKRDRERKLIQKIQKAIQKMEDGTYGICEECGDEISEERLKVRPEASLCIKCKEEQEKIEKQLGL